MSVHMRRLLLIDYVCMKRGVLRGKLMEVIASYKVSVSYCPHTVITLALAKEKRDEAQDGTITSFNSHGQP